MIRKVIKAILTKKVDQWLKSIEDEDVRKLASRNTIITGGAIANMLLNEEVKDFDIYFRDKETTKAVALYYVDKFNKKNDQRTLRGYTATAEVIDGDDPKRHQGKSVMLQNCEPGRIKIIIASSGVAVEQGKENILAEPFEDAVDALTQADETNADKLEELDKEKPKYRPVFLSSNAITLSDKIQLVVRFYGEPDKIHENYDFTHCTNYFDYWNGELVLKPEALECLMNKQLKYQGSKYPLCSIIRTRKFLQRGFQINAGQYLKMCFQLSQLDLTDISVLEDQLVGVDSAYFMMLITALKQKQDSDPNWTVDTEYITTIVDKIF